MNQSHDLMLEVETPLNVTGEQLVDLIQEFLESKGFTLEGSSVGNFGIEG